MTKDHRRFHHIFWFLAVPVLALLLYAAWDSREDTQPANSEIPAASSEAIVP